MATLSTSMCVRGIDEERRRGKRLPLRWQARLIRRNGATIPTTTENLSSCGFYCHTAETLIPGEEFDCYIILPSADTAPRRQVVLLCRGHVARVESVNGGRYGIGCQIDDYLLIPE